MTRVIIAAALLILAVLPVPVLAAEPTTGTVEVSLVNGTKGGVAVSGQDIEYKVLENGAEKLSKKVRTDDKGKFVVDGLSVTDPKRSYQIAVNFQDADYESEKITFDRGAASKSIIMTVYDATDSDKSISVNVQHVIVYPEENGLLVKSYALFNNVSNLTYTGSSEVAPGKKGTLRFSVPPEATELEYGLSLMSCCVVPGDESFSDTMAFIPGAKETVYTYTIPYSAESLTLTEKFSYPTDTFNLLIAAGDINVGGGNLNPEPPVTIEGKQFSRFSLQNLAPGETVKIDLSGLPRGSARTTRWLLWGAAAVVVAGGGYFAMRRRAPRAQPVPVRAGGNLLQERRRLVTEIARLDDTFESGSIEESVYQKQRAAKKARLLKVMQLTKDSGRERS